MTTTSSPEPTPAGPTTALAEAVSGLDLEAAQNLKAAFGLMFDQAHEWIRRAAEIRVTDESQTREMKFARESRLALRDIRVNAERERKRLKEDSLRKGKAIDGIANVIKALIEPVEAHLLEQEQFADRAEKARHDALCEARRAALLALGTPPLQMPSGLGQMTEDQWRWALADARAAKEAREQSARLEGERREAERKAAHEGEAERQRQLAAERAENERLRAEAAERERASAAERERAEADLARADLVRRRAEAEAAALRQAEAERLAREAEAKKPTRAKYAVLLEAVRFYASLTEGESELCVGEKARAALVAVGESP